VIRQPGDHGTSAAFYFLGSLIEGQVHSYTGMGTFHSAEDAAERCNEADALVFEQRQLWRNGVNYGMSKPVAVATCTGTP
jgi:hypothetical protein